MPIPVIDASDARIDQGGVPVVEGLNVKTTGSGVVVLGAPRALFQACAGILSVTRGTLRVGGALPREAAQQASIASAPMDVLVPPKWTLRELVIENVRLAGHPRREATERALAAVHALGLDAMARTKLGAADLAVKRGAMLAAAVGTGAGVLLVEDFTTGLPDASARSLGRLFVADCKDCRWVFFAGQLALASPVGMHADEALLFGGGRLLACGPPAEIAARERTYSVRLAKDGGAFAEALRGRGVAVETDHDKLVVTLPEGLSPLEVVRIAVAQHAVVLELVPVSDALV